MPSIRVVQPYNPQKELNDETEIQNTSLPSFPFEVVKQYGNNLGAEPRVIKQNQNEIALEQNILVDPNTEMLTPASISQLDVLSNTGIQIP